MYRIVDKEGLAHNVERMVILAPRVAKHAHAGQFIILRVDDKSERLPLTIADYDRDQGTITIIYQVVGRTTEALSQKDVGDFLEDFVGPLGKKTETDGVKKAVVVGGGVGCAIALPILKALHEQGTTVYSVTGFRSKEQVILEEDFATYSEEMILMTDDGSYGQEGRVTKGIEIFLEHHQDIDCVYVIGPIIMMKHVAALTKGYNVKTTVSMNPIMVDGTGMCGGCRLTVDGKVKFACVDGPEFDGHQVDYDELMKRNRLYHRHEENCRLFREVSDERI